MTATPFARRSPMIPNSRCDLVLGERRRRLVHDHDARVERDRAGDLHQLDLRDRQVSGVGVGSSSMPTSRQQPAGVAAHPVVVHEARATPREPAQPDVLHDGARRDRVELLLDHRDAGARARPTVTRTTPS